MASAAGPISHQAKETKMKRILQQPEAVDRRATVASATPERSLDAAALDRVAAAGGATAGVLGTTRA
jgi:hypothetical protein